MRQKRKVWVSAIWGRLPIMPIKLSKRCLYPASLLPIVTVTVGYPVMPLPEQVERLPLAAVVHQEAYVDYTPDMIDELYGEKEALEVNKQFVKREQ